MSKLKVGDEVLVVGVGVYLNMTGVIGRININEETPYRVDLNRGVSMYAWFTENELRPEAVKPVSERERKAAAKGVRLALGTLNAAIGFAEDKGIEVTVNGYDDIEMAYQPPTPPTKTY